MEHAFRSSNVTNSYFAVKIDLKGREEAYCFDDENLKYRKQILRRDNQEEQQIVLNDGVEEDSYRCFIV